MPQSPDAAHARDFAELQMIYDRAPLGLCLLDRNLRIIRINERLARISGQPAQSHVGRTLREILPHIAETQEPIYLEVVHTGKPALDIEVSTRTPSHPDEEHVYNVSYLPLVIGGRVEGVHAIVADITEQRRAEEVRARGERRLRRVLETAPDALILVSRRGTITFANERVEDVFGYAHVEIVGEPAELLLADRDRHIPAQSGPAFFDDGEIAQTGRRLELRGLRKDGTEFDAEVNLRTLESEAGRSVSASIRDVSERSRTQRALSEALAEVAALKDRLQDENAYLWSEVRASHLSNEIVGDSPAFEEVLHRVAQVAPTDATVLLLGETGSGKEGVARAIHRTSRRSDKPLIVVNCAALASSLIESELFGHEKGAFTGAVRDKIGRFELADGGTVFLDEIGELSVEVQAKLLRVLQEGQFERVGGTKTRAVDVRVMAATNRDLESGLEDGSFRADLYYRLTVFPIHIPSLRDRRADIPLLAWHFVGKHQRRMGKTIRRIPSQVLSDLTDYPWPGNVRELENVIERALILSQGDELVVERPFGRRAGVVERKSPRASDTLSDVEREHILGVLEATGWVIKGRDHAAERLGLHPSTLLHRMKKLGIERPGTR